MGSRGPGKGSLCVHDLETIVWPERTLENGPFYSAHSTLLNDFPASMTLAPF